MRYEAVIFDLDGTLINTIPDIVSVVNSVMGRMGFEERSEEQIKAGVGFGVEHLLRTLGVPEHLNSSIALEVSEGYSVIDQSKSLIYPGVKKMIRKISQAGIKLFVLSNKPQMGLEKSVSDHLSPADFLSCRGSRPGEPAKPLPDTMLQMLREFEIKPGSALMVGDGEPDVLVSKAAGMDCLSVLWGFRTREILEAAGGEMFVEHPAEVLSLVLKAEL